jgi:hypothetical protein
MRSPQVLSLSWSDQKTNKENERKNKNIGEMVMPKTTHVVISGRLSPYTLYVFRDGFNIYEGFIFRDVDRLLSKHGETNSGTQDHK